MTLVDGVPAGTIPVDDRGLLYGDGLFETVRFAGGRAPLWALHMGRLSRDAARIGIAVPDPGRLHGECLAALAGQRDGVVRITLTRGSGGRGYAPPAEAAPRRLVAAFDAPAAPARPLRLTVCGARPLASTTLAGVKHLSRIAEVLAAAEVRARGFDDGLLLGPDGSVLEAVSANVFVRLDGQWVTPPLETAGVAGVFRRWLLDAGVAAVAAVGLADLSRAQAMFVGNAVRGAVPVGSVEGLAVFDPEDVREHLAGIPRPWSDPP